MSSLGDGAALLPPGFSFRLASDPSLHVCPWIFDMHDTSRSISAQCSAGDARRVAIASAIGTTIEWYDFFIYGTAAAVVFGPQFFPLVSERVGTLAAFATFAIGFIARPLGGIVMGHFGDRLGRKSMLVWSLMLMGLSTLAIGLLPTYSQIGIWAPALLIAFRFIQGFALGGEWGGAVLMSVEHAPQRRRGFFGSFVALGLPAGIILSNLVFLIASIAVTPEQFAAWAWRIPFLASAVLVLVGLFVRLGIPESPVFAQVQMARAARRMPVIDVLRSDARTVLLAAGSYLSISALGYITIVYFVSYATRELSLPLTTTLTLVLASSACAAGSIVTFAIRSDRFGRRRIMRWGMGALVLWSLIFFPLVDTKSIPLIALSLSGMLLLQGAYLGPQPAVFSELFPTAIRYSGASLCLTLGTILGGAPSPFSATALFAVTGNSWLVTTYLTILSLISWLCMLGLKETYRESL
jgi:MFS family permease